MLYVVIIQPGFLNRWFYTISLKFTNIVFSPGQIDTSTFTLPQTNSVSGGKVYCSILGLDVVALDSTHELGFSVSIILTSSTGIQVDVTYEGNKDVTPNLIYISAFIFNNNDLALVSPVGKYFYGAYSSTNANNAGLRWIDSTGGLRSYNTIVGLRSFYIKGDSFFNYQINIQNGVDISSTSTNNWIKMGYDFIVFEFFYCTDPTPYFLTAQSLCYDICPIRYCQNTQYM